MQLLRRRGEVEERDRFEHRDHADRDEQPVDEVIAREAEKRLVGDEARRRGERDRGEHRERVGHAGDLGEVPRGVRAEHHEHAQGEVDDAGDAEGQRDAEGDDAIERADDRSIEELTDDQLRHGAPARAATAGSRASR